jgi:ribulose-phosphate 3-epimerase
MKISVSLWSADLLELGAAVNLVAPHVDGLHLDVMDGRCVPNLLFGPDFISALRARTRACLDVHVMMSDTDGWLERFAESGSDMITVHRRLCSDVRATLAKIREFGKKAGMVVELGDPIDAENLHLDLTDRLLVMGTEIGIKGQDIDPRIGERIKAIVCERDRRQAGAEIFVDGGIRRHTVPMLATAGADGVIPGSLVFADKDPCAAIGWIKSLGQKAEQALA